MANRQAERDVREAKGWGSEAEGKVAPLKQKVTSVPLMESIPRTKAGPDYVLLITIRLRKEAITLLNRTGKLQLTRSIVANNSWIRLPLVRSFRKTDFKAIVAHKYYFFK